MDTTAEEKGFEKRAKLSDSVVGVVGVEVVRVCNFNFVGLL